MVANMALPADQPQLPPPARGGPPDHHQYAWLLKADRACKADGSHGMIPSPDESSNSWDARAFAEDASSLAAGIWPPRAYPCSFCRREFRSAQALGGHMNVHRRDRARMRHSSPPPPFCATHNISLQPATIMHKSQHGYSSNTGLNPNTCQEIYPNESLLSKASVLPTALPLSAVCPQSSTPSFATRYPSDMAASFPLRLHLLASEAASTLMLRPQADSLDQLSLWPASALDSGNGCHSTISTDIKLGSAIDISSWSASSSSSTSSSSMVLNCSVTPSMGATPCRRTRHDVPNYVIQLEDESPRKKSNVTDNSDYQPYDQAIRLKNCLEDAGITQAQADKQTLDIFDSHVDESIRMQQEWVKARDEYVDLELRLGQKPP